MKRELRFRAWQTVTKTMFTNIQKGTGAPDGNPPFADYLENPHMIVMQYTEMTDSNGCDIYEGDILEVIQPYATKRAQVMWGETENSYQWMIGQTWLLCFDANFIARSPLLPYLRYGYEMAVVGNIYETPEMVK